MQDLPHHYYASAKASADSHVAMNACDLPEIITAAPLEFGGPGEDWCEVAVAGMSVGQQA